jgi:predicted nucleotidyltransferase
VTVFWLDREAALQELRAAARRVRSERSEVSEVRLFGSLARGTATAGSDADLLIVVSDVELPVLGRHDPYVDYFRDVGLPVEIFVCTAGECDPPSRPLVQTALAEGILLS